MTSRTVVIDCDSGNEYRNSNINVRISSIFVILIGSTAGALLPYYLSKRKNLKFSPVVLSIMKYFGSGVIIATAFIHLLAPAAESLGSPCLTGPITNYSWSEGIVLITIFIMFMMEFLALRFDVLGPNSRELESQTLPSGSYYGKEERVKQNQAPSDHKSSPGTSEQRLLQSTILGGLVDSSIYQNTEAQPSATNSQRLQCGSVRNCSFDVDRQFETADIRFSVQLTSLFILEFGVIFHSIFIGLTLAVTSNDEYNILYIVLFFHQTFEGLGVGSRLESMEWPKSKRWMPWALGLAYGLTTPAAIAIGLTFHSSLQPGSQKSLIVNGIFDSISAGILIYTGLVELMAHEFMYNQEMRKASIGTILFAFFNMCCGAALMSLLGLWI